MTKRLGAVASALLLSLSFSAARAQGNDAAVAEALFRDGQRLMKEGRLAEACTKLRASHEVDPALGTLLNLAVCNEKLGKTATAWTQYAEVRAKAVQLGQAERGSFARGRQEALEPRLVRVVIEAAERQAGMKLKVDGAELPAAALGVAVPMDPGNHLVEASAPAFKLFRKSISLREGGPVMTVLVPPLEPGAGLSQAASETNVPEGFTVIAVGSGDAPGLEPPEEPGRPLPVRRIATFTLLGAGAVGLAAAGVLGFRTLGLVSDRDELCPSGQLCRDPKAMELHDSALSSQTAGLVALGVGAAAAGVGAWLFLSEPPEPGRLSLLPQVGPGALGLGFGGAW